MDGKAPPSKKEVMLALLERAEARVHLDARRPGVRLPTRFLGEAHLRLDYGYGFSPPIPDLDISDEGIAATLSFSRVPFATFVPWAAVYLIADFDGNGAIWQEDIPADLKLTGPSDDDETGTSSPAPSSPSPSPSPSAALPARAEPAPGATPPDDKPPEPPSGKKPRPSHLKLVK